MKTLTLTIAIFAALIAPVLALEKIVTTKSGLQARFTQSGLVSLKVDADSDGNWDNDASLLKSHYIQASAYGKDAVSAIPVSFCADRSTRGFECFGTAEAAGGLRSFRARTSYCIPTGENLVFVRVRVVAQSALSLASEFNFRTEPTAFYSDTSWLPDGTKQPGKSRKEGGILWTLDSYPDQSTGVIFTGKGIGFAYQILKLAPGNYWQARLPANTSEGEGDWQWGGILSPMFREVCRGTGNVVKAAVPAGKQFLAEYCFYVSASANAEDCAKFLKSKRFAECYKQAVVNLDAVESDLARTERQWLKTARGYDPQQSVEKLKLWAVKLQVEYENLKAMVDDGRIRNELSPSAKKVTAGAEQVLAPVAQGLQNVEKLVNRLESSSAEIGAMFSTCRDLDKCRKPLDRALIEGNRLLTETEKNAATARRVLKAKGLERPADKVVRNGKLFTEEPLQGTCWFSIRGTGPDRASAELLKMKAVGMNAIVTSSQTATCDVVHSWVAENDRDQIDALLRPFREAGLKAIVGLQNTSNSTTPEAINARGLPDSFLARDYQAFGRQEVPDYENPEFCRTNTSDIAAFASYLKQNYSDVVWGFDYNNEMCWNLNFSPHAKTGFLDYMKERYGTVEKLNAAWKSGYVSWEDAAAAFGSVRDIGDGKLGDFASRDWSRYTSAIAYGRRFWGNIYNGVKSGYPEAVCIGRDPGEQILQFQDKDHRMTDVIDGHWLFWGHGKMAPMMRAISGGKPFTSSEFWWACWSDDYKIEQWFGKAIADQSWAERPNAEELQWGYGCSQMWNYFLNDCNGFMWFAWNTGGTGYNNALVQPNGFLRKATAKLAPVFREARFLSPIVRRSRIAADIAVFIPLNRPYVLGNTGDDFGAAFLAMQALNIPHDGITEAQITTGELSRYRYLLLACGEVLPDSVATAMLEWVRRGGVLIPTGRVGVFDEMGQGRSSLQAATGVSFVSERADSGRLAMEGGPELSLTPIVLPTAYAQPNLVGRFNALNAKSWDIAIQDSSAKVLGRYDTGQPAIVEKRYGAGKVITCGAPVEKLILKHATALQPMGEDYTSSLLEAYRHILTQAGVNPLVRVNQWGELRAGAENVQLFVREDKTDPKKLYVFLINIGRPIAGCGGAVQYALPYVGQKVRTRLEIDAPISDVREILRGVAVQSRREGAKSVFDITLEPYRCYALEVRM